MLVRSGIRVVKYWFSITDEEQQMRFLMRIRDPMKQRKLSPMDLEARVRWEQYTKAREEMLLRTSIPEAPWHNVEGNDKKRARLNMMDHLLGLIPYGQVPNEEIVLPQRVFNPDYERRSAAGTLRAAKILTPTHKPGKAKLTKPCADQDGCVVRISGDFAKDRCKALNSDRATQGYCHKDAYQFLLAQ